MDGGFYTFADEFCGKYEFALLSNDVSAWSENICEHYGLNRYLSHKIVSADVGLRKRGGLNAFSVLLHLVPHHLPEPPGAGETAWSSAE